jgi:hypothetical protein
MPRQVVRSAFGGCVALIVLGLAGCGHKPPPEPAKGSAQANLEAILNSYRKASNELKRPPKSLDEFKSYLKQYGDPEQLLISPRDGQPFVLVLGTDIWEEPSPTNPLIIAYEKEGKDGRRFAVMPMGAVIPYTADEMAKFRYAAGHKFQP